MSSWWSRLWMTPTERKLADPTDYRRPLDPAKLLEDVAKDKLKAKDPELIANMMMELDTYVSEKRPLTIAALERDAASAFEVAKTMNDERIKDELLVRGFASEKLSWWVVQGMNQR